MNYLPVPGFWREKLVDMIGWSYHPSGARTLSRSRGSRLTGIATSCTYVRSTKFATYRLLKRGELPPRMALSPRSVGWRVAGVDAYL